MKNKARNWLASAIVLTAGLGLAAPASAAVILSPVSATVELGTDFDIGNVINQSALTQNFVSGSTVFDSYFLTNPMHDWTFGEAFILPDQAGDARVVFDLGAVYNLSAFALWNEDSLGIPSFDLSVSVDGLTFVSALAGIVPTANTADENYGAQTFNLGPAFAQYVRLDMVDCSTTEFEACGIGEVAFRGSSTNEIPEPGVLGLTGVGLLALGLALRQRRRTLAS